MFIFPTIFIMTIHIYFKKWLALNICWFCRKLLSYPKIDVETGNEIVIDDYHMRLTHLVLVDATEIIDYYHYATKFSCDSTHAISEWDLRSSFRGKHIKNQDEMIAFLTLTIMMASIFLLLSYWWNIHCILLSDFYLVNVSPRRHPIPVLSHHGTWKFKFVGY